MSFSRKIVFCFIFSLLSFYEGNSLPKHCQTVDSLPVDETAVSVQPFVFSNAKTSSRVRTSIPERFLAPNTKILFSIDGGGSRGYIPAYFVSELLKKIEDTILPVDMLAGTSVGSLLCAGIAVNRGMEVHDKFPEMARTIFKRRWKSLGGFSGPRYGTSGMRKVINEYMDGDAYRLINKYKVNITFACAKKHNAFVYRNYGENPEYNFVDALIASASAPSYFKTHIFMGRDNNIIEGVDGGVWKNDPAYFSYLDMKNIYQHNPIVVISLGTGDYAPAYSTSIKKGILWWASKFPDLSIAATAHGDHEQFLREERYNSNVKYIRINPTITDRMFSTDNVSDSFFGDLEETCERFSAGNGARLINETVSVLNAHKYYRDMGMLVE